MKESRRAKHTVGAWLCAPGGVRLASHVHSIECASFARGLAVGLLESPISAMPGVPICPATPAIDTGSRSHRVHEDVTAHDPRDCVRCRRIEEMDERRDVGLPRQPWEEACWRRLEEFIVTGAFGASAMTETRASRGARRSTRADPLGLTLRERQVFDLLLNGLSNRTIADRMHRSERTVEHHVSAVLAKVGVRSRNELFALVARQALSSQVQSHGELPGKVGTLKVRAAAADPGTA